MLSYSESSNIIVSPSKKRLLISVYEALNSISPPAIAAIPEYG